MHVWLFTVGEPLPIENSQPRLLRTGILANLLADRGHEVVWWTSAFDHFRKRFHFSEDRTIEARAGLCLKLLHGCGYRSNVSLSRLVDHRQIARKFAVQSHSEMKPDLILCSFPTIELSVEAVRYGHRERVPVVLDIRDFWPDVFVEIVPPALRPLARIMLHPLFRATREACAGATAVIGITPQFVEWGLRLAGRPGTRLDRDFPHGYVDEPPPTESADAARALWRARGLQPGDSIACFFGTIGRQFELETVIEAAAMLRERCPSLKFVLCGSGDRLDRYRVLAHGLQNVLFPGWVQSAEIWTLMRLSLAGLAPYRSERSFTLSLPNKVIEYLSAGLPIVSSLDGAVRTLIAQYNCGLAYENADAAGLAENLCRLYEDAELRSRLSTNADATFRERFVANKVYGRMIEHLETVCSEYRRSATGGHEH